jgi:hypothetical protein
MKRYILLLAVLVPPISGVVCGQVPAESHAQATFDLEVKRSEVMKAGKSTLTSRLAFASVMHRESPIKFKGVDIFLPSQTSAGTAPKNVTEVKRGEYANINILLDKSNQVTQVNISIVVPGSTVARTVAWKAEDLKKYFSDVTVEGRRITLKSKGVYEDPGSESEQATLRWNVDVDVSIAGDLE